MSEQTTSDDLLDQIARWADQIPEAGPIRALLTKRPTINVSTVIQQHIDYHYSMEAGAESTGATASERFHRKSAEYLEKIKRGEPPNR